MYDFLILSAYPIVIKVTKIHSLGTINIRKHFIAIHPIKCSDADLQPDISFPRAMPLVVAQREHQGDTV